MLIAFDLDGTLVDSRRDLAESANALLAFYGARPLEQRQIIGRGGGGGARVRGRGRARGGAGGVPGGGQGAAPAGRGGPRARPGGAPAEALMVGDSHVDFLVARAA